MNPVNGSIPRHSAVMLYRPGSVLLAAFERVKQIRQQDDDLKRQIDQMSRSRGMSYERARRAVLASKGLLK